MKGMRHVCDVYAPLNALNSLGQKSDGGSLYLEKIPCSKVRLNSREIETARLLYATASHRVGMYADPKKPIDHTHWLMIDGKRLNVAEVVPDDRGLTLQLICGEVVA